MLVYKKQNSVIYSLARTVRPRPYPVVFLQIHIFALPLQHQVVSTWRRSFLYYLLLTRSSVRKSRIWSKTIGSLITLSFSLSFFSCSYSIKSYTVSRNWGVSSWCWLNWPSLQHFIWLFFMLINPELVGSFIHFEMRNIKMRVAIPRSRS